MRRIILAAVLCLSSAGSAAAGFPLDELDLTGVSQGWGRPQPRKSVDGNPLTISGTVFDRGIGGHANAAWIFDLNGKAVRFTAWVGHDDEKKDCGSEIFEVRVDGATRYSSGVMKPGDPAKRVEVGLVGAKRVALRILDAGDGIDCDHGDWIDPRIEYAGPGTPTVAVPTLEPPPDIIRPEDPKPRINGPHQIGATLGRPFLFRIPATGARPMTFSAKGLPAGLVLNPMTGIISGVLRKEGWTLVSVSAVNVSGTGAGQLGIGGGKDLLAQTPPMGWNSWNVWGCAVDQKKIEAAAEALVSSGLADHGYTFINIDDCWEGTRGPDGRIRANEKFPDMKGLADKIHSLGLKLGIYTSPGPKTCAGREGSWNHELTDAWTYAKWGVDYLKYDWCSYESVATGEGKTRLLKPYAVMRDALAKIDRDIVYSVCQYGMGNIWEWGPETGGQLWRTTGDISDTWASVWGIVSGQPALRDHMIHDPSGPGRWNDPDMLVVGNLGWGPNLHPTRLTRNEQILHMTAWVMLGAPLLIGCDLTALDPFTLALLTNDEVLAVDAHTDHVLETVQVGEDQWVWVRHVSEGDMAVALFNAGLDPAEFDVEASMFDLLAERDIALEYHPRDLWAGRNLEPWIGSIRATVPAHGAALYRVAVRERRAN